MEIRVKHSPKVFPLSPASVEQIDLYKFNHLSEGEVVLVRSSNVSQLGDHYVVIAGPVIQKPHGFRPKVIVFHAYDAHVLNSFQPIDGVIALKLDQEAKELFHWWFGIKMRGMHVLHQGYQLQ